VGKGKGGCGQKDRLDVKVVLLVPTEIPRIDSIK
jgi:hypothetical protein